jgi:hypothetical protein
VPLPYKYLEGVDCIYIIDTKLAIRMGVKFFQTATYAVINEHAIPAECIHSIINLSGKVIWSNAKLISLLEDLAGNRWVGGEECVRRGIRGFKISVVHEFDVSRIDNLKSWTMRGLIHFRNP